MRYRLLAAILLSAAIISCRSGGQGSADAAGETGATGETAEDYTLPADPNVMSDLSIYHLPSRWITQQGEEIELSELRGDVLVVAMIYTTCQFACPRLVADMKAIEAGIDEAHLDKVNIVLVSIDPERDQPDTLRLFAEKQEMDPQHWTLLHGDPDDVLEFSAVLGVKYKKVTPVDFSHSNIISIFNREGELVYQQEGYGTENIEETIDRVNALLKRPA